jgi:hypothetical protein
MLLMITFANSRGLLDVFSIIIPDTVACPCCADRLITFDKKIMKTITEFFIIIILLNKE